MVVAMHDDIDVIFVSLSMLVSIMFVPYRGLMLRH